MFERKKRKMLERFRRDESGATAIEYALLCGLIALSIFGVVTPLAPPLIDFFTTVFNTLNSV